VAVLAQNSDVGGFAAIEAGAGTAFGFRPAMTFLGMDEPVQTSAEQISALQSVMNLTAVNRSLPKYYRSDWRSAPAAWCGFWIASSCCPRRFDASRRVRGKRIEQLEALLEEEGCNWQSPRVRAAGGQSTMCLLSRNPSNLTSVCASVGAGGAARAYNSALLIAGMAPSRPQALTLLLPEDNWLELLPNAFRPSQPAVLVGLIDDVKEGMQLTL